MAPAPQGDGRSMLRPYDLVHTYPGQCCARQRSPFYHLNRPQRIPGATGTVLVCGRRDKTAAVRGEVHSWYTWHARLDDWGDAAHAVPRL